MANPAIIALVWLGFVFNLGFAALVGYGFKRVYESRYQIQWSARHSQPLFGSLGITVAFLAIERNLQLLGSVSPYFDMGFETRWVFNNLFSVAFLTIYGLRCWLVHFDYHTGVAMFVRVTNIKLSEEEEEHFDWFLENKTHYGSPKYLNQFLSIMVLLLNVAFIAWSIISPATFYYGMTATYTLIILIVMGVAKKITVMDDEFFIRRELLLEFRCLGVMLILVGIFVMFGPVMGWNFAMYFILEFTSVTMTCMACIATYWMLDRSQLFVIPLLMEQKKREQGLDTEPQGVPPLRVVLNDKVAVATFLKHLIRELSVENLFFLADVMHFKKSLVETGRLPSMAGFFVDVPDLLARYAYIPDRTFTQYAWALSRAYVDNVSAFYVTAIEDDTREEILGYLEELNFEDEVEYTPEKFEELGKTFDNAAMQVYALVKQSYKRFVKTPKFKNLNLDEAQGSAGGEAPLTTGGDKNEP